MTPLPVGFPPGLPRKGPLSARVRLPPLHLYDTGENKTRVEGLTKLELDCTGREVDVTRGISSWNWDRADWLKHDVKRGIHSVGDHLERPARGGKVRVRVCKYP